MFLGVSGNVLPMDIQRELTDSERAVVANRLLAVQRERFDGVRKAAYTAAKVNPATWARATSGERIRPDRLVLIVKSLWPESRGEWEGVPNDSRPRAAEAPYRGPTWVADADDPWTDGQVALKDYVDDGFAEVDERIGELVERVRELERMVLDLIDPENDPLARRAAGGAPASDPSDTTGMTQGDYAEVALDGDEEAGASEFDD